MTLEPTNLRRLAAAIEFLEALNSFDYQVRGDEIRIEWLTGSSCAGYAEMRKAIAQVVTERYQGLRLEAIAAAEKQVAELRAELAASMQEGITS